MEVFWYVQQCFFRFLRFWQQLVVDHHPHYRSGDLGRQRQRLWRQQQLLRRDRLRLRLRLLIHTGKRGCRDCGSLFPLFHRITEGRW